MKILSTGKYELYHRDLEIRVRFLWTDEGGREGPVFTGYRSLLFLDNEYWGAEFDFKHSNPVYPGETVDASLEIISFGPEARRRFLSRLSVGTKIEICEGKKVVAVDEVTKITELKGAE